jgi:hypothetical protein
MIKKLQLAALTLLTFATLGLAPGSASANSSPIPFRASFSGSAAITSPTTTSFAGTGVATEMGRIANQGHVEITGSDPSCPGGVANVNVETLTAANNDTLTVTSQDVACPAGPGLYHGSGQWTVTGGTGRFNRASGEGSYDGSADFNAGTFTINLTGNVDPGTGR